MSLDEKLKTTIRDVHNYPKPGIVFKDITPVLASPSLVAEISDTLRMSFKDQHIDAVAGVEARGFIFGAILARELQCRFIPVRKKGKLPYKTRSQEYQLEYGTASIEIHDDAIQPGWKVLVHDDLLATGGTAGATAELVKGFGGTLAGFSFIVNLGFLPGERNLIDRFGVQPQYLVTF